MTGFPLIEINAPGRAVGSHWPDRPLADGSRDQLVWNVVATTHRTKSTARHGRSSLDGNREQRAAQHEKFMSPFIDRLMFFNKTVGKFSIGNATLPTETHTRED